MATFELRVTIGLPRNPILKVFSEYKKWQNVQIVEPISTVIENENPKTMWEDFADIVSRWKAPRLKTLGRLLTS